MLLKMILTSLTHAPTNSCSEKMEEMEQILHKFQMDALIPNFRKEKILPENCMQTF